MKLTTRLRVELLEPRDVPTVLYVWIGSQDTNATNPANYMNAAGEPHTIPPDFSARILIGSGQQRTMHVLPGDTVTCSQLVCTNAVALASLSNPNAATYGNLCVSGTLNIDASVLGMNGGTWAAGYLEIDGSSGGRVNVMGDGLNSFTYAGGGDRHAQ